MYISNGNLRMKIPTFSLPAIKTCPNSTSLCKKYCYARKSERVWKNVLRSRYNNFKLSKQNAFIDMILKEETFTMKMIKNIGKRNIKHFRIHESGDFYSQKYLEKWFDICRVFNGIKFLAYTQMYNLNWKEKPKNMIVYWTVWPDTDKSKIPKGLRAYVIDDGKGKLPKYTINKKIKICAKGKGNNLTCDKCLYCYKGSGDVVFKIH